jgi:hypothetical protein
MPLAAFGARVQPTRSPYMSSRLALATVVENCDRKCSTTCLANSGVSWFGGMLVDCSPRSAKWLYARQMNGRLRFRDIVAAAAGFGKPWHHRGARRSSRLITEAFASKELL